MRLASVQSFRPVLFLYTLLWLEQVGLREHSHMHLHFPGVPVQLVHSAPSLGGLFFEQSSQICAHVPQIITLIPSLPTTIQFEPFRTDMWQE